MTLRDKHSAPVKSVNDEAPARQSELPPLSEDDRRRLLREWTEANMRGDLAARRRVRAEILGNDPNDVADNGPDREER
jgi:hypothetical protein